MQAARHRGHLASAECTGTAAPGAYRTPKCPTPRAYHAADGGAPTRTSWEQLFHQTDAWGPRRSERRPRRGPEREEKDTGSLTRAWLSRAPPPPSSTTTLQPGAPPPAAERMRNDARARGWPGVGTGLKIEDRRSKIEESRRSKIEEEVEGRGSLTRTALAAAVGCMDSLISGRQARSVRSTPSGSPMRAALIRSASTSVRPPAVSCVCSLFCASLPPSATTSSQPGAPPAIERMRDDARARGWPGVGTGSTPRQGTERREEVEGRGSLTRTALAAAGGCVDSLISGRQARSVRSTSTRVTDACRLDPVGVHQRPTTGGRLRVRLELCLPPPPRRAPNIYAGCPPPPAGCACAMTARARVWVGDWAPARCQSMDPPDTDHCHLSRRGRVPDEKTSGHEAAISPPSRTCTLKIEGVEDPRARVSTVWFPIEKIFSDSDSLNRIGLKSTTLIGHSLKDESGNCRKQYKNAAECNIKPALLQYYI
ncbi:hypothetical protein EVAR_14935_1 [Eumeta japonica]|uniref:Uncharacterized protein n=1 Tax=Eumeta variegata TaxID=151549 RepID=A0A4C1XKA4_EUMVA|nr:hypothetical protein EVAR_14935_1 [Eumeta japonica]